MSQSDNKVERNHIYAFFDAGLRDRDVDFEAALVTGFAAAFAADVFAAGFFAAALALVVPVTVALALGAVVFFLGTGAVLPATTFLAAGFLAVAGLAAIGFVADFLLEVTLEVDLGVALVVVADFLVVAGFAAGFLVAVVLAAVDFAAGFLAAGAFVVVVLVVVEALTAGLDLAAGLFSLVAISDFALGASLTLPLAPFGREKVPFSAPVAMALESCVF